VLSRRTVRSLAQFLHLQDRELVALVLEKHGLDGVRSGDLFGAGFLSDLVNSLDRGSEESLLSLLGEVARTAGDLRSRVNPKYSYDERFQDLQRCAHLDGYVFENRAFAPVDPTIVGATALEDDLTSSLRSSGLPRADDVIRKLEDSASNFRNSPPNYNASLNDARVALETLATTIAEDLAIRRGASLGASRWGPALARLRELGLITVEEERGLGGVFGFVSPGSHRPVGLSDEEMTRLGRSLVASMCYFLVKRRHGAV